MIYLIEVLFEGDNLLISVTAPAGVDSPVVYNDKIPILYTGNAPETQTELSNAVTVGCLAFQRYSGFQFESKVLWEGLPNFKFYKQEKNGTP